MDAKATTTARFDGLLVVDKPLQMTSRTAVDRAQRWFPRGTRLGHTGTLDPLATGVLVLCVGAATRLTEYVQQMSKTYQTTIRLGARSVTDDAEGPITEQPGAQPPTRAALEAAVATFIGTIAQVPSTYSAARVNGARAYDLARKGEEVSLTARPVRIDAIMVERYEWPWLDLVIECGKGTYIRSLARDLGERLACGGMVQTLRRTRVGPFTTEGALATDAAPDEARSRLRPLLEAVESLPRTIIQPEELLRLRDGRGIPLQLAENAPLEWALLDSAGTLLALAHWDAHRNVLLACKMLV